MDSFYLVFFNHDEIVYLPKLLSKVFRLEKKYYKKYIVLVKNHTYISEISSQRHLTTGIKLACHRLNISQNYPLWTKFCWSQTIKISTTRHLPITVENFRNYCANMNRTQTQKIIKCLYFLRQIFWFGKGILYCLDTWQKLGFWSSKLSEQEVVLKWYFGV